MKYTITLDKQITPNTFDSVLVFVGTSKEKFEDCLQYLGKAFIHTGTIIKIYYKHEEEFTHATLEIKV